MDGEQRVLGAVEAGTFRSFGSHPGLEDRNRLTDIPVMAAMTPESGELDLTPYEGQVIMVEGRPNGDWTFSAAVIEVASLILSAVARSGCRPNPALVSN